MLLSALELDIPQRILENSKAFLRTLVFGVVFVVSSVVSRDSFSSFSLLLVQPGGESILYVSEVEN